MDVNSSTTLSYIRKQHWLNRQRVSMLCCCAVAVVFLCCCGCVAVLLQLCFRAVELCCRAAAVVLLCCCRPLIQNKLNVLGKAGLSKDDFCDADMHMLKVLIYTWHLYI